MITNICKRKQSCCKVTHCPLVPAWATTIHKFQGFEAGFDETDQFKHLIVDPGDLTTELQNPGILYVALSWAKTIGTVSPNTLHPKNSATLDRFRNLHDQSAKHNTEKETRWYHDKLLKS